MVLNIQETGKADGLSTYLNPNTAPFVPKIENYNMLNDVSMICNSLPCNDVDYIFNITDNSLALSTSVIKSTLNPIAKCFIPSFLANIADEKTQKIVTPNPTLF